MVWDLGQCVVKIKAASEKFDQISGRLCCRQWTNLDPDFLYQINWKESVLPVRWKVTKGKKGNLAKKKRMGLGQGGWGAGGGRPLLSLRMRKSCRNQSLNVLIVFLRSPVHHDRHRQSQDEDADESAKASNQLRKELLKSESVAGQEVSANSANAYVSHFQKIILHLPILISYYNFKQTILSGYTWGKELNPFIVRFFVTHIWSRGTVALCL